MTTDLKKTRPPDKGQEASFVQVYSSLLLSGIPSDELHVWLVLRHYAGSKGYCWVADRTIGDAINRSQGTASRIVGRLEQRGLVRRLKVEVTPDNPTGRVLEVLGVVQPRASRPGQGNARTGTPDEKQGVPRSRGRGTTERDGTPASVLRHELDSKPKKQHGPATGGEGPPARTEQEEKARDAMLRAAWAGLPEAARTEIHETVIAANPGLARWPKMMEPLCLAELEARLSRGDPLGTYGNVERHADACTPIPVLRVVGGG